MKDILTEHQRKVLEELSRVPAMERLRGWASKTLRSLSDRELVEYGLQRRAIRWWRNVNGERVTVSMDEDEFRHLYRITDKGRDALRLARAADPVS